jgi:hypothetical protein
LETLACQTTLTLLTNRFIAVNVATQRRAAGAVDAPIFPALARVGATSRMRGFLRRNAALRQRTIFCHAAAQTSPSAVGLLLRACEPWQRSHDIELSRLPVLALIGLQAASDQHEWCPRMQHNVYRDETLHESGARCSNCYRQIQ